MSHILIVEDEENLRLALHDNLEEEGYQVTSVGTGAAAQQALATGDFQLIILDIVLPDTDGYALCREVRAKELPARVLMLTARTLEDDLVSGFEAGADDYLAKPYRLRELLARVRALLGRTESPHPNRAHREFSLGDWHVDVRSRTVIHKDGRELELTRTEFDVLAYLISHPDQALTRDQILSEVWGSDVVVDTRTVDNFVSKVKAKLGWTPSSGFRIRTIRGVGYRIELDGEED
jgi:DNA-binding response OmpR family regulator